MTLQDLLATLQAAPPTAPLVFTTNTGEIGSGYHLTELKLATITGIDCGGRVTAWNETAMQLLDGSGGAHLATGKVVEIIARSIDRVPGLGEANLHVEFAPENAGLRRFEVTAPLLREGRMIVALTDARATCKALSDPPPAARERSADAPCCA